MNDRKRDPVALTLKHKPFQIHAHVPDKILLLQIVALFVVLGRYWNEMWVVGFGDLYCADKDLRSPTKETHGINDGKLERRILCRRVENLELGLKIGVLDVPDGFRSTELNPRSG